VAGTGSGFTSAGDATKVISLGKSSDVLSKPNTNPIIRFIHIRILDYSLWKATKNLKRITHPSPPLRAHLGTWANSNFDKAHAFAHHLSEN
jgi:hypothetical protein